MKMFYHEFYMESENTNVFTLKIYMESENILHRNYMESENFLH